MRGVLLPATLGLFVVTAHADLPLTVEDLITDKGKLKLDLSLSYANSERQGVAVGDPIVIQTGPTSFVTLPGRIGESRVNNDTAIGTVGLRYGLTGSAELYGRVSYLTSQTRASDGSSTTSDTDNRFADVWAGLNYRIRDDGRKPALLGFVELALRERHQDGSASARSVLVGMTTYRALDPVVLTFTGALRHNLERQDGAVDYQPGGFLLLNPQIAFAVNEQVTLTTGLQWKSQRADRINDEPTGFRRTGTDWVLGVGYGWSNATIINFSTSSNQSGPGGAELRLNLLHTFGKKV